MRLTGSCSVNRLLTFDGIRNFNFTAHHKLSATEYAILNTIQKIANLLGISVHQNRVAAGATTMEIGARSVTEDNEAGTIPISAAQHTLLSADDGPSTLFAPRSEEQNLNTTVSPE